MLINPRERLVFALRETVHFRLQECEHFNMQINKGGSRHCRMTGSALQPFTEIIGRSLFGRSYSFTIIVWRSFVLAVNGRNVAYTGSQRVNPL